MDEIIVRYENLPLKIKAMLIQDPESDYNIYLNVNHNIET